MIREKNAWMMNGYVGLLAILVLLAVIVLSILDGHFIIGISAVIIAIMLGSGITIVQPNQSVVVMFFGRYMGSIRHEGLVITIPFSSKRRISLKVRNFNSSILKVNDVNGNPIDIAAVIVFRVVDSAKAVFEVDYYEEYVKIQSETAIRAVATQYPYDTFQEEDMTLRGEAEEVSKKLANDLQQRLNLAGVEVLETRLTHLAYSTEVAQAMLQKQQASAIIAARQQIVEGAVEMVEDAVSRLEKKGVIILNEEKRAAIVNNLLVSIVSEGDSQPVINTGKLNS